MFIIELSVIPSWLESVSPVVLRFLCDLCFFSGHASACLVESFWIFMVWITCMHDEGMDGP